MQNELMATLISVYPFEINESKPGLYPGNFHLPAADKEPQTLVIGEAFHFVETKAEGKSLKVRLLPQELAQAIVEDYITAHLGTRVEEGIGPGLFWVPGAHKNADAFFDRVELAKQRQRIWFQNLIKIADDDWERYHKHAAISDIQRYAVKNLGLDRDWSIKVEDIVVHKDCPACMTQVDKRAIICPNCKHIFDPVKYKEMAFIGA